MFLGAIVVQTVTDASAQTVQGTVRVDDARTPVAGALVSLWRLSHDAGADALDSVEVLTRSDGTFTVQLRSPGRFVLRVKRIGFRAWQSQAFELAAEERRVVDVDLEGAGAQMLNEVVVSTAALCTARDEDGPRVAQLWEDASAALRATRVSLRDTLVDARMTRYTRELAPRTLRVLSEKVVAVSESGLRPFRSAAPDSLAAQGFWGTVAGDSVRYEAPDHDVLLSLPFLRGHCFGVVDGNRARDSEIGLAFSPPSRRVSRDIEGVMWLDRVTHELRSVEFRYTGVQETEHSNQLGGQLHFARLPSGAWVVRRWFVRMPLVSQSRSVATGIRYGAPEIVRLVEEGGSVVARGVESFERPGRVVGVVRDSTGRALPNAVVSLDGTQHVTRTSQTGAFELSAVPPGVYEVVVNHEDYDRFGLPAATSDIVMAPGDVIRPGLRAIRSDSLLTLACAGQDRDEKSGTARIRLLNPDGSVVSNATLRLSWVTSTLAGRDVRTREEVRIGVTDSAGGISFCDLPAGENFSLELVGPDTNQGLTLDRFTLTEGQFISKDVRASQSFGRPKDLRDAFGEEPPPGHS